MWIPYRLVLLIRGISAQTLSASFSKTLCSMYGLKFDSPLCFQLIKEQIITVLCNKSSSISTYSCCRQFVLNCRQHGNIISRTVKVKLVRRTFGDDHKFIVDQLIQLDFDVRRAARKAGMRIGNPNKEPAQGGLPFVYDMIIRHGESRNSSVGQ